MKDCRNWKSDCGAAFPGANGACVFCAASNAVYLGSLAALIAGISGAFLWEAPPGSDFTCELLFLGILALFPASELALTCCRCFSHGFFRRGCCRRCRSRKEYRTTAALWSWCR